MLRVLKIVRITNTHQLLAGAASAADRDALARAARLTPDSLTTLVQKADLERVNGLGAVFRQMLRELDIRDVARLAQAEPA